MQHLAAESFCVQVKLGQVSMVSLPSDIVPKRINWAKWADGVSISSRVVKGRSVSAPRLSMSPDHLDSKDNLLVMSPQSQSGLERIDLLQLLSTAADETKFLFVGSWQVGLPSWFKSLLSVFAAKYSSVSQDVLHQQASHWAKMGDMLESRGSFLVVDDLGRVSALSGISKAWRARLSRSNLLLETRAHSWFAATVDVHMPVASNGQSVRLHRLHVLPPESWCGSPAFNPDFQQHFLNHKNAAEIWISAPSLGAALWIADQVEPLVDRDIQLRMPSAILGWHPLRDAVAFVAEAPPSSVMLLVDGDANLQFLMKERDGEL